MSKSRKRKQNGKKKNKYSLEIIGVIILFLNILILGNFGFIGVFFSNVVRIFVGDAVYIFSIFLSILGLYFIFKGKKPTFKTNRFLGSVLLFIAVLIFLHLNIFNTIMNADVKIVSATWRNVLKLFSATNSKPAIGGGMIGAIFYASSYFLFANIGTYFLIIILSFIGIMNIGDFSYNHFFKKLADLFRNGFNWIKKWSLKIFNSKSKKSTPKKNVKKSDTDKKNEVIETETEEKEMVKQPVPIEGMKQTSLPIGDVGIIEEEEKEEEEVEEENDSNLEINFVTDEENEDYQLPPLSLLDDYEIPDQSNEYTVIENNIQKLEETFESFGVRARVVKANLGPAVTKYEIEPATGVKVSRILNLTDDIALSLAAKDIRIEAPIPGKALIGIEVPNSEITVVYYNEVMQGLRKTSKSHPLEVPLGKDIGGHVATADLSKMPHLLIAGATGSGKSVAINVIISSILMRTKPHEVKMMLIDPKMVELNIYEDIPHLLTPVVTKPKKAARALQNVVEEMEKRYELFAMSGTRNIESYNEHLQLLRESGEENVPANLPFIVVVVDELADLMMVAAKEVEDSIIRLAQMARAAGIHMILATQRPSVDVITGLIKANVPSRVAFATSSGTDSRTILDENGAEKLLGRGDMLFLPMGANKTQRIQGAYISDSEVQSITDFVREQQKPSYVKEMIPTDEPKAGAGSGGDELYEDAFEIVKKLETASISLLQRRLRIGYNRAANIMDDLEANGIVSAQDGAKPRDVLISPVEEELDLTEENNQIE